MRLSFWGLIAQVSPGTELDALVKLGLLSVREQEYEADVEPTARLLALFPGMPPLERVYPLLVEIVLAGRYRGYPGFTDLNAVRRQLRALGMPADGVDSLVGLVGGAVGRR